MNTTIIYALLSTILVSLISFVGLFLLQIKMNSTSKIFTILLAFAIGTLLGSSIFHFIPQSFSNIKTVDSTIYLLGGGILFSFFFEKIIHSFHSSKNSLTASYGYLSLYADALHNFMDGILIGLAWLYSFEMGITTTLTVLSHEIPQELSDFGILLKAGFTKKKALKYNFLVGLTSVLGTLVALWLGNTVNSFSAYVIPIMAGGFIYLAFSILFTEVKSAQNKKNLYLYILFISIGLALMYFTGRGHNH